MEKLLDGVMTLGEQMLKNGGEVHRVEDSIKRIFFSYGAERTDVFIITSSMVVTVHTMGGEILTQTRRITDTSTDFEKLHQLNELSRNICENKISTEEINKRLKAISDSKKYPLVFEFICYSLIACAFTLFFGGTVNDAVVSFVIGAIVRLTVFICDKTISNKIFVKFVSSLCTTLLAYLALRMTLIGTVDKVIIGNIMTLIPGIGLTNALKDLFVGDSIAGLLRTIESCIIAVAIAAGYFTIALIMGGAIV